MRQYFQENISLMRFLSSPFMTMYTYNCPPLLGLKIKNKCNDLKQVSLQKDQSPALLAVFFLMVVMLTDEISVWFEFVVP